MNSQNRKMKLKRSNEIRNLEEFSNQELDEIKNVKREIEPVVVLDNFEQTFSHLNLNIESNNKEETSV